jgi:hypothetical protein
MHSGQRPVIVDTASAVGAARLGNLKLEGILEDFRCSSNGAFRLRRHGGLSRFEMDHLLATACPKRLRAAGKRLKDIDP